MTYLVSYYDYILGDLEDDLGGDLEAEGHVQRALKLNPSIFEGILQIVVGFDLEDDLGGDLDGDLEAEGHVQRALKLNPWIFDRFF